MALRTLYQTLMDSDMARLRVIAQQWGIELLAERRADISAELAEAMARVEAVADAWRTLDPEPRAALEDLLRHESAMPWAAFTRRWGRIRMVGPGRLEREALWQSPISPAESLWYWGFLQRAPAIGSTGTSVDMAFVPESLALYLPAPPPLEVPLPETTSPPLHVHAYEDHLCDDLAALFAYVQNHDVHSDPTGTWPDRHDLTFARQLRVPSSARRLLQAIALEQEWLELDERSVLHPVPKPMLDWLRAERWDQWETLARAWLDSQHWNDLALTSTLRAEPDRGWPNDPLYTRQNVLEILARCTPGVWYPLEGFIAHVREYTPDYLRPNGDYDAWNLRDALTDIPLRGFEAWDAVEGALLATLLVQPLAWLGIVDLGSTNPLLPFNSFRIGDLGTALFGESDFLTLPLPEAVELEPGAILNVPLGRRYEHFQLSRIAEAVDKTGGSYRFRLTSASLSHGRQQNIPLPRILDFLSEATTQTLPAALRKAIERAYRQSGQVQLARAWILRVKDPDLLNYEEVRDLLQERLSPRVALIHASDVARLSTILIQAGLLVDVEAFLEQPWPGT